MKIILESGGLNSYTVDSAAEATQKINKSLQYLMDNDIPSAYQYINIKVRDSKLSLSIEYDAIKNINNSAWYNKDLKQLHSLNQLTNRVEEMLSWIPSINKELSEYGKLGTLEMRLLIFCDNQTNKIVVVDIFSDISIETKTREFWLNPRSWGICNSKSTDILKYANKLKAKVSRNLSQNQNNSWRKYAETAADLVDGDLDSIVNFVSENSLINSALSEVYDKLQLFAEPSVQGNMGSLFIYDDSGEDRFESFDIDWEDWNNDMIEMIASSKSKNDFKAKLTKYFNNKIAQNSL